MPLVQAEAPIPDRPSQMMDNFAATTQDKKDGKAVTDAIVQRTLDRAKKLAELEPNLDDDLEELLKQ